MLYTKGPRYSEQWDQKLQNWRRNGELKGRARKLRKNKDCERKAQQREIAPKGGSETITKISGELYHTGGILAQEKEDIATVKIFCHMEILGQQRGALVPWLGGHRGSMALKCVGYGGLWYRLVQ